MPFRQPGRYLKDILESIDWIEVFTHGIDFNAFQQDPKTIAAVERKLLTISEAATRLGAEADRLCPGIPWQNVRGIGNRLRHEYDRVDLETVWFTVTDSLPAMKRAVSAALDALP